jgi:hypothetical protein
MQRPWADNLEDRIKSDFDVWLKSAQAESYDVAAADVRVKRNAILASTDASMALDRLGLTAPTGTTFSSWLSFLKTIGTAISGEMAVYRQALRDITTQDGFPYDVVWPEKPPDV